MTLVVIYKIQRQTTIFNVNIGRLGMILDLYYTTFVELRLNYINNVLRTSKVGTTMTDNCLEGPSWVYSLNSLML